MDLGTVIRYERELPNGRKDVVTGFVFRNQPHVSPHRGPSVMALETCGVNSLVAVREAEIVDSLELCPCAAYVAEKTGPMDRYEVGRLVFRYTRWMIQEHGEDLPVPLWTAMRDLTILHGYALNLPADQLAVVVKERPRGEESEWWGVHTEIEQSLIVRG
jgi:hypothetical protein